MNKNDLAIVVNADLAVSERLAAIERIQDGLADGHRLKEVPVWRLLDSIKDPWTTRKFVIGGRAYDRTVLRPPQQLADVW